MSDGYTNTDMRSYAPQHKQRRYFIIGIVLFILIVVLIQVSRYSFLEIQSNVSEGSSDITYQILNQATQKNTDIKTSSIKTTKLVPRASYEVLIHYGDTTSFHVVKTGGFFTKTVVQARLLPQKQRQFTGNNPNGCMFYIGQTLYSYTCGDSTSSLTTHVPATATQPTYTVKNNGGISGFIEGSVVSKEGVNVLVRAAATEGSTAPLHTVYVLGPDLKILHKFALPGLSNGTSYVTSSYKDGFMIYDDSLSSIFYYSMVSSKLESISREKPTSLKQKPFLFASSGDSFSAMYSDKAVFENQDNPRPIGKITSEFFMSDKGQTKHIVLAKNYVAQITAAQPCGSQKLCILAGAQLTVYDTSGVKPQYLYMISGVSHIQPSGSGLLVVKDNGVLNIDIDSGSGYVDYSFGSYKYCGVQNDISGYLLCLTNTAGKNVALRVDQNTTDKDSIDKKVSDLQQLDSGSDVSAYGNFIFITPNLGDLVYDKVTQSFAYNPSTQKSANSKINAEVQKLGIDTNRYKIINTTN